EMALLLERALEAAEPPRLGGEGAGVQVLSATHARGCTFEHLFVLGMNRDVFPRGFAEDALMPDTLRRRLRDVLPEMPVKERARRGAPPIPGAAVPEPARRAGLAARERRRSRAAGVALCGSARPAPIEPRARDGADALRGVLPVRSAVGRRAASGSRARCAGRPAGGALRARALASARARRVDAGAPGGGAPGPGAACAHPALGVGGARPACRPRAPRALVRVRRRAERRWGRALCDSAPRSRSVRVAGVP